MLTFDFNNIRAKVLGDNGLDFNTLSEIMGYNDKVMNAVNEQVAGNKVGFIQLLTSIKGELNSIINFAKEAKGKYSHFVVFGIGGSSLGGQALKRSFEFKDTACLENFHFIDNVDPELIMQTLNKIEIKKTLFIVITKSGGTIETISGFYLVKEILEKNNLLLKNHIVVITDPERGFLRKFADDNNLSSFSILPSVGGRFSVLTPVGLLPSALMGIDIEKLVKGAEDFKNAIFEMQFNPAYISAVVNYLMFAQKGKTNIVMMPYSYALEGIADWFRQLWAESLGKQLNNNGEIVNAGQTPIKAVGSVDQHSQLQLYSEGPNDKLIVFIEVEKFRNNLNIADNKTLLDDKFSYLKNKSFGELLNKEKRGTELALVNNGRPNYTIKISEIDETHIGALFMLFELQTAYIAELFNINAYDQPGVELSKNISRALMGASESVEEISSIVNKSSKEWEIQV